jgi:carboxypeptidase PM20D1
MPTAAFPTPTDPAPARAGIAERLGALIRLATVSSEADERAAAFDAVPPLLRELYPRLHEALEAQATGSRALVFRWPARDGSTAAPVVLLAHFDVVATTGQDGSFEPFCGDEVDGRVLGRGAIDDKGALVTLLDAVENLLAEGFQPRREVWLCLGPDEEVDGVAAAAVAEDFRARGVVPWLVLDEGGAVTDLPIPGVSGAFGMVGLTEKGVLTVRLGAAGTGGHASAPPRLTAAGRVARAVHRV